MRTTLDVADDVLAAANELPRVRNSTAGDVISRLARQAPSSRLAPAERTADGFRTIPRGGHLVTHEHVNAIRVVQGI